MKINALMEDAYHVENFISKDEVETIYSFFGRQVEPENKQKTGTIGYFPWDEETGSLELVKLRGSIDRKIRELTKEFYKLDLQQTSCIYKKMFVGDGHSLHIDNAFGMNLINQYVGLLMITDDFEGGTLRFPIREVSLLPAAGDLVLFMGDERMAHSVDLVTSGTRDNVVMYYHNPEIIDWESNESLVYLDYVWDESAPYGVRLKRDGENESS
jgi:hypothetical protein